MRAGLPAVLARGLAHRYASGRTGLDELELRVEPGEVVAVLGPNGSGKSTLLRLLATDLRVRRGSLSLLGHPVRGPGSLRSLRRRIRYASDRPAHVDALTVAENLRFFAAIAGGDAAGVLRRGRELLEAFGLGEVENVPAADLSFGMRRKLLLVESLAPDPELLLLDEPTVGLDPRGVAALRDRLEPRDRGGMGVVLASNEVREVPMWADRIVLLHRGRAVHEGSRRELLARLRGRTRIEVELAGVPSRALHLEVLRRIPGIEGAWAVGRGLVVESSRGGEPLPELLGSLLPRHPLRDIRIREPDLGDLFRELTGEAFVDPDGGAAPRPSGGRGG